MRLVSSTGAFFYIFVRVIINRSGVWPAAQAGKNVVVTLSPA
jgi:hypothetical protein